MIAIADGGCYPFYLLRFYLLWFYGSNYRSQVQVGRQTDRLRQAGRQAQVRQVGRQAGSSQAVRLKSGSVMMEALERTFVHRPIRI